MQAKERKNIAFLCTSGIVRRMIQRKVQWTKVLEKNEDIVHT